MAPRYQPPIAWPSVQVPWLSMVLKADPDWARRKHREAEYAFSSGKVFYADPYVRGSFEMPSKIVTVSYSGPITLAAGDITGVGMDMVTLVSESTMPGDFTTRTAAQMFADMAGAVAGVGLFLRIVNNAVGGDITLHPGAGVIFNDVSGWQTSSYVIRRNAFADFKVQFPDSADCVFAADSQGSMYSTLVG